MRLGQVADDSETKAEAAVLAGRGAIGLPEAIEDEWQKLPLDSLTGITYHDLGVTVSAAPEQAIDPASRRGELDRVRQQVPDHLAQTVHVAHDDERIIAVGMDLERDL